MRPLQVLSIRRAGLVLAFFGTLAVSTSCQKKAVCDDVPGSCLALTVVGQGPFDELRTELSLPGGSRRVGTTSGNIDLPLTLRVLPPSGVSSTDVSAVTVAGVLGGATQQTGSTPPTFAWPDGAHLEATVSLEGAAVDGGVEDGSIFDQAGPVDLSQPDLSQPDLSGPPPTLRWTAESVPVGLRRELYGVWSDGTRSYAVGQMGTILTRGGTGWTTENSATGVNLHGASGFLAGSAWAVGQSPGSLRRGATWANDNAGLALQAGEQLWSVTAGGTAGELWAGGGNGKVWKRSGAAGSNGSWTSEQALPAGNTVYSVSYAGGTVFAVGQRGWVGVRRGTAWQNYQYTDLAGSTSGRPDALYGVSAIAADSAVAVGTKGLAVRYSAGSWRPGTVRIDPGSNEFNAVWGSPAGRWFAVAYNGLIVRLDGNLTPTQLRTDGTQSLYGIFGNSESDIYVVGARVSGDAIILHGTP
ncbi:MAG: hypothetical protein KAY55_04460 [Deltaproteobacteria bacterium]|nr:hypothetical protein [Deltaproteobacteria bacterium]